MREHDTSFRHVLAPDEAATLICSWAHPGQLPSDTGTGHQKENDLAAAAMPLFCPIFIALSVPQGHRASFWEDAD
jgi:hypothetical protein